MQSKYQPVPQSESDSTPVSTQQGVVWLRIWQGINLVMTVFFLLSAYVQINDPDPYIWIPVYIVPAILSLSVVIWPAVVDTSSIWRVSCIIHIALCCAYIVYLSAVVAELTMTHRANPLRHEEGRELAGLIIVVAWLGVSRFTTLGNTNPKKGAMNGLLLVTAILGLLPLVFWGFCFVGDWRYKFGHCQGMFPE